MEKLTHEEMIKRLNELLDEDVTKPFEEQLENAGEHGHPSFAVSNSEGKTVEIGVEWDKEADQLYFTIDV
ncbi:hypothetical protein [Ornithinibacillus californiensis]|uniref:hypothetical protein n=1 Tax=Ornithinibacillus californiensis TaxID=161536 RepID=UPI00064DFB47|nr:hypothetical protein [Ornithinibacillus californiensis]